MAVGDEVGVRQEGGFTVLVDCMGRTGDFWGILKESLLSYSAAVYHRGIQVARMENRPNVCIFTGQKYHYSTILLFGVLSLLKFGAYHIAVTLFVLFLKTHRVVLSHSH